MPVAQKLEREQLRVTADKINGLVLRCSPTNSQAPLVAWLDFATRLIWPTHEKGGEEQSKALHLSLATNDGMLSQCLRRWVRC
jgi:catalase (peroxidase I)